MFLQWMVVLAVTAGLDLAVRFLLPFRMPRVLAAEAVLFPLAGLLLLWMMNRHPASRPSLRIGQAILAVSFLLAGLRSFLWALGVPIQMANVAVIASAGLVWVGFRNRLFGKNSLSGKDSPA
jgi:hypothetical protein